MLRPTPDFNENRMDALGWLCAPQQKCNTTPVWSIVVATAATWSRLSFTSILRRPTRRKKSPKSTHMRENTHLPVWKYRVQKGCPTSGQLSGPCQGKGGLVDATPWDANMDAEQKLKGRVSVDQRMMTTTAQSQQRTGVGLAFSLPVHFSEC